MNLSYVKFRDFKPYYGECSIDLSTEGDKNVILVGGRNGQGKTSFLVGVVWCLYGNNISIVDKIFKDEVRGGNYTKFLLKSLNKKAVSEGKNSFSVEVGFTNVELSEVFTKDQQKSVDIVLKRSYNTDVSGEAETFEVLMDGEPNALLSDDADKRNFVNDYLIPIEIAKFVFFDAEKIAEIAQLGAKDQATLMDEAFGQVLGLNTYENLILDLETYESSLQKESASTHVQVQINSFEKAKSDNDNRLIVIENGLSEIDEQVDELRNSIAEDNNELIRRGDSSIKFDIEKLKKKEEELNEKREEVGRKFNEVSDLIPFAILGSKIEEVKEHIEKEAEAKVSEIEREGLADKTKEFAESLFNTPPFPEDDIEFEQKHFYYIKAKRLLANLYQSEEKEIEFDFEHDLDNSDVKQIHNVFELVKTYTKNTFEGVFNE